MIAEIGTFLLVAALLLAVYQAALLYPHATLWQLIAPSLPVASWLQTLCLAGAFGVLVWLRLDSDFSVVNVVEHSNLTLPTLYKIVGAWGNHEGSMLLWVLVLSAFGLALVLSARLPVTLKFPAVAVQAALAAGVLLFMLSASNPFERQFPPPADGATLNPILQDIALAMHPPLLYVGYVGFSIVFSLAVAALLSGETGRSFARSTRPWILASWTALTLGIGLGSWWAYRELGWGGFWFWDPVENASLLPWLAGTALLHSNVALEKRGQLAPWVMLLSILTFGLSLLGTFLVRSGALTSVHSFASDPARGVFLLGYMAVSIGGALLLYAIKMREPEHEPMLPASREGMIVFNNLFLLSACAVVLFGTLYPLFAEWIDGQRLTVGPPYFNSTFVPLMILPLLLAGLAPLMPWKQASFSKACRKASPAMLAAFVGLCVALAWVDRIHFYAAAGVSLAAWLFAASIVWLVGAWRSVPRLYALSVALAHGGVALLVLGATATGAWQQESNRMVVAGDVIDIAGYRLRYEGEKSYRADNYETRRATLTVGESKHVLLSLLAPEYRRYDISGAVTHEAAIYSTWVGDLYAVIGERSANGDTMLRIYYNPMVRFLWIGCLLMGVAGIFALLHARRRSVES